MWACLLAAVQLLTLCSTLKAQSDPTIFSPHRFGKAASQQQHSSIQPTADQLPGGANLQRRSFAHAHPEPAAAHSQHQDDLADLRNLPAVDKRSQSSSSLPLGFRHAAQQLPLPQQQQAASQVPLSQHVEQQLPQTYLGAADLAAQDDDVYAYSAAYDRDYDGEPAAFC
jgi:hypothetical protein